MSRRTYRCHSLYNITRIDRATKLTDKQSEKLNELLSKIKLTDAQAKERNELIKKRDAKETLSSGAKTYIQNQFLSEKFDYDRNFSNKYTEKGIMEERGAIREIVKYLGLPMVVKNEERLFNDYVNGEPDTIFKVLNFQMDVKNVFEPSGLDMFDVSVDSVYEWQQHGYNWLCEVDHALVAKILRNPRGTVLDKMIWDLAKEAKVDIITESFRRECEDYLNFERMPIGDRIRLYTITTEKNHIDTIKQGVDLANEHRDELEEQWKNKNKKEIEFINQLKIVK